MLNMVHRKRRAAFAGMAAAVVLLSADAVSAQDCPPEWTRPFAVDPNLYPFTDRCLELDHGIIHYVDEGPIENPTGVVLMIHGNPTWSFLFRDVIIDLLADDYRVIAPDLYGYGFSDKPDPDVYAYSARAHADVMAEFVTRLDIQDATLLMHDWGGPIGFTMAADLPERITSVVITNTWGYPIGGSNAALFHDGIEWGLLNITNGEYMVRTGVLPRRVGELLAALHGAPGSPEYRAVRDAYWAPFLDVNTGLPLGENEMRPTNRMYEYIPVDPGVFAAAENGVKALADRPVAFVIGARDDLLGALRCNENATPQCPGGTTCQTVDGLDLCIDNTTREAVFPALDAFLDRWIPAQVRQITISRTGGHFISEYEAEAIADAVRAVQ